MPPAPQENVRSQILLQSKDISEPILGDKSIVISGISGMYPEANNVKEFADILYNKVNPVSSKFSRWQVKHPELTEYVGKAPGIEKFDAQFFTVNYRLGIHMDPMARKLLEHTYQAIYDAGLNIGHLSGKKVAVFVGSSFSDSEAEGFMDSTTNVGLGIVGTSKAMIANRISYWLNVKGPSLTIDESDGSSTAALKEAYLAMQRGECEAAIVGGLQLYLYPQGIIHHKRLAEVSNDGKTRSYSENASGYVLSDAVNVLFLQRAEDALRIYAEVLNVKTEHLTGFNNETVGYYRNIEKSANFIKEFYKEVQVPPQSVEYIEGYGIGVKYTDKSELEAIAEIYCKDRSEPLLVGSVTSNIGLTGPSSGIAGITKVLLGYYKGELAANLNYEQPQKSVLALQDGRMRIVTEHQPFRRTYTAINGISASGCNTHILLYGHYKPKDFTRYISSIPRLITISGRQESSVIKIIEDLKSRPIDAEEIALFHNIHSKNIAGHLGRGYVILDCNAEDANKRLVDKTEYFSGKSRPLWFVYSGMGSQWAGMGAQLMRIPIFASAIERCQRTLAPKGLDIVEIICSPDETMFDNILHSFVGIAAIQIGLTDILRAVGLVPDGIIGHSVGELGCAYADECLTAEEMILAAYSRGIVSLETPLIRGSMAAVGVGYQKISKICPPEIDVACRNSSTSSTISGPADVMRDFVGKLKTDGVFAKEVPCSNIAYHSRYIADAGPNLLKYLKKVIKNPKPRSNRWLSTSVPQNKWNESIAKYCSAEYHTNNLLSPVLFEETCSMIPSNALLLEVAPHGLLQAILKRSLPIDCRNVALTRRKYPDSVSHLLQALGSVYIEGFALNLQALYPAIQFPVSTETPMLSHLVEWMHTEVWPLKQVKHKNKTFTPICKFVHSIHDREYKYLQGHIVRKKMCYPFAAALISTWDTFVMHEGYPKQGLSIEFQDVHLYAQPLLFDQKPLRVTVSLHRGTGQFEVTAEHTRIASGIVMKKTKSIADTFTENVIEENTTVDLPSKDIYQLLNERDYDYSGDFRSIELANMCLNKAALVWSDNWVTFIDGMIQLNVLRQPHHAVSQPVHIKNIDIDVEEHFNNNVYHLNGKNVMQAEVVHNLTRCGGVTIKHIQYQNLPHIDANLQKMDLSVTPSKGINSLEEKNPQHNELEKLMTLESAIPGKLDSLCWAHSPCISKSNVNVSVFFAGLNRFDVKKATAVVLSDSNTYGMDYSGITKNGERVMGLVSTAAVSSQVDAQIELLWPVPKHWSLEDAATVPYAYTYAFYALVMKGSIEPGMNILIHEGTDAIGQAAIAIAFAYKCQVFTTVSDVRKRKFLRKLFPQLPEENIGNACDTSFSYTVLLGTNGQGCDIVISCVKGELKEVSLKCCGGYGVLIDTVQIEDREEFVYGMSSMTKSRSYLTVNLSSIFMSENQEDMKTLQKLVSAGLTAGYVVPLSRVTYALQDVVKAFNLLAKNQHYGRVLLHVRDNKIQAQQRIICDAEQCQIMFWNNDTIGVQLAERLIHQGAKKLYISCTNLSPYQKFKIRSWQQLGVKIEVFTKEFTKDLFQTKVLNNALNLGNIESIYVILTTVNTNETIKEFVAALDKLDSVSRLLCHQLKHFVLVSSIKTLGEKICSSRVNSGLTITWLDLSCLSDIKSVTSSNIVNAIEDAICSKKVSLLAQAKPVDPLPLSHQVFALADISNSQKKNIEMEVTFKQLGVGYEKYSLICNYLNTNYGMSLEESQVPYLTLKNVHELENYLKDFVPPNTKGLSTFISNVYSDELLGTADIVMQSTLSQKVMTIENDFDITGRYLCILPGVEGHYERFSYLCERLKIPACVLQSGLDHPYESPKETAQRYAMILFAKTKMSDEFYLLGYESGVLVAFELAAILEDKGMRGTVFCLGYAPSEFQEAVQDQLSNYITENQLQDAIICHLYTLLCGKDSMEMNSILKNISSWTQKVNVCIRHLLGQMKNSAQYARAIIEATFARLVQARQDIVPVRPLHSKVVLLRAASTSNAPSDESLQILSHQPVSVHQLQLPLSCVSRDMQCSALVNQYLNSELLKEFENKNLCEFYNY